MRSGWKGLHHELAVRRDLAAGAGGVCRRAGDGLVDVAALTGGSASLTLPLMSQEATDRRALHARMQEQQALVSSNVRREIDSDLSKGRSVVSVIDGKIVHEHADSEDEAASTDMPAATA